MQIILIRSRFSASGNRAIGGREERVINNGFGSGGAHRRRLDAVRERCPGASMASLSDQTQAYLKKASPRFRELYATFERAVRERFPDAEASFQFPMPGWRVRRRRRVDPASVVGTLDPNWVQIYLEERKFGTILHLWNPIDVNGFRKRKADLE